MTAPIQPHRRRRRRRGGALRLVLLLLAGALLFLVGLGVGRALEENSSPGEPQTLVRTLDPLPLGPERETVTVTVTAP